MRGFIVGTIATAIAFYVVTAVLPDYLDVSFLTYEGELVGLLGLAVVFGLVNGVIGPIVRVASMPVSFFTMGLAGFIINGVLLLGVATIAERLDLNFQVGGYPPGPIDANVIVAAIVGAVVLGVVNSLAHSLLPK